MTFGCGWLPPRLGRSGVDLSEIRREWRLAAGGGRLSGSRVLCLTEGRIVVIREQCTIKEEETGRAYWQAARRVLVRYVSVSERGTTAAASCLALGDSRTSRFACQPAPYRAAFRGVWPRLRMHIKPSLTAQRSNSWTTPQPCSVADQTYHVLSNGLANASCRSPWKQSAGFTTAELGIPVSI
jgi:hypothetical protein